jgi:hypothetical protein
VAATQNRAVPTHHRTPDNPRWRSRLALDVGEGQKQTRCIDSPVSAETGRCQMRREWMGSFICFTREKKAPLSCTQNRAVPTHHRTPDNPRWRSRLALDVGEGQKQTRRIDSPVSAETGRCRMRREWMGSFVYFPRTRRHPSPAHRTGLFPPTTALPTTPVGVPASPWMWAKARSKLGALIRLCLRRRGDVK